MSLVRADGLYRRRIFYSGRHTSRRITAIGLVAALGGAGALFLPGTPRIPLEALLAVALPAHTASLDRADAPPWAVAAALPEQPVPARVQAFGPEPAHAVAVLVATGGKGRVAVEAPMPAPAAETIAATEVKAGLAANAPMPEPVAATIATSDGTAGRAADTPVPAPAAETIAASEGSAGGAMEEPTPAPTVATIATSAPPEARSVPPPPPMPPATTHARQPQRFVQLSYYSDPAGAHRAAVRLRQLWRHVLVGVPVRVMPAEALGEPIWRVVAGPVPTRERATKVCAAVKKAGRSCSIALM